MDFEWVARARTVYDQGERRIDRQGNKLTDFHTFHDEFFQVVENKTDKFVDRRESTHTKPSTKISFKKLFRKSENLFWGSKYFFKSLKIILKIWKIVFWKLD